MTGIIPNFRPEIDIDHSRAALWPDEHPRSKRRLCQICGKEARLYACGPRCDQHSPRAMRAPLSSPHTEPHPDGLFDLAPTPKPVKATTRRKTKDAADPPPTGQQVTVIDTFRSGSDLVIEAGAGAGKTSTLKMCAKADGRRGAYIVFGKANAAEAQRKFPANVICKTAHGFAMAAVGNRYRHRLFGTSRIPAWQAAEILGINEPAKLAADFPLIHVRQLARIAIDTVRRFTHSADPEITAAHLPRINGITQPALRAALAAAVVPYAAKAWGDLCNIDGKLRFEHDHYLKMWSLTQPQFDTDYVLLDEAQDADPSIAFVVDGQRTAQRILVGDVNQAIYGWRGAINAMEGFAGQRLPLSQSFRFGQAIADEANQWLRVLRSRLRLTGYDAIPSRLMTLDAPDAVLCRTNAQTINEVGEALDHGRKVAIAGGGGAMRTMAQAALDLQSGRGTDHPDLFAFTSWEEVCAYVNEEDDGADLRTFVSLIETHGADGVIALVDQLTDEKRADVVVSTAHKAKGQEWKTVRIADDFPEPKVPEDGKRPPIPPDTAMLAYVAVTRAQQVLDRSGLAWIDKWVTP